MANNIHETSMDSQLICNNHRFCQQMTTINDTTQINQTVCHKFDDHITYDQDQNSATFLFEPFKLLLNDLIYQNSQLKQDINQLKEQNQSQQQIFVEQLTQQSTTIAQLQDEINQLKANSIAHTNDINKIQTDNQNQNSHLLEVNQSHNLLKIKVKSIQKHINYRKCRRIFEYIIILIEINVLEEHKM
jgi:septal ring factor EnvC (AmiA/AmiB activator)